METLTVLRNWSSAYNQLTTLVDSKGKVKEVITSSIRQPKYNTETITLTKKGIKTEYKLNWGNVVLKSGKCLK